MFNIFKKKVYLTADEMRAMSNQVIQRLNEAEKYNTPDYQKAYKAELKQIKELNKSSIRGYKLV